MELANRMRQQNHEQFETLVRMHLSFELDLNTDDNGVVLNEKGKFRKRFQFNKKTKSQTHSKSGSPVLSKECIEQLRNLMEFLMKEQNVIQEGIFRRTGSVARQNELKTKVNDGTGAPLHLENGTYSVHDCASVLKGVLADLPEPLLTDTYGPAHQQMAELCNSLGSPTLTKATRLLHSLQLLILLLPIANRLLLKEIIEMLHETIKYESSNKMSADSLATLFTPHLICPKKLTPEALHSTAQNLSGIISFMITKGSEIFDIPPKLSTDIRAYFVEQKRKQTMSPEQILDESVTSDSTANTVYTFIDRERTAQAHVQNPTDTCLAQLYAYIQSLPESSKKRKLIKQFNKENGQGTPLQVQKLHRLKNSNSATKSNSKSLGDSIKRHIFQKNLMSKTPKPAVPNFHTTPSHQMKTKTGSTPATSTAASGAFETPNRTHPAQLSLKSRVLFQSPVSTPNKSSTSISASSASITPSATPIASTSSSSLTSNSPTEGDSEEDHLESTEFELLSETITKLQNASHIIGGCSMGKKSVGFVPDTFGGDQDLENRYSADLKSRHKSEPNLTQILNESNRCLEIPKSITKESVHNGHRIGGTGGRYIANKLLKGVSMVNLMLPTQSPSSGKSTTASVLYDHPKTPTARAPSLSSIVSDPETMDEVDKVGLRTPIARTKQTDDFEEDIDDPDFVATPNSQRTSRRNSEHDEFSDGYNTPGLERQDKCSMGRKSMSPITKSTQRMSKAMQESIMTPRSRKPLMLNGALFAGLTDQTHHHQNSFSSFREEDEDELAAEYEHALGSTDLLVGSPSLYKSKSEGDFGDITDASNPRSNSNGNRRLSIKHPSEGSGLALIGTGAPILTTDTLSSTFRNYLFSRSVVSTSPVDSSFSSHPDDFGSSPDLDNLIESTELSESLLYCLDGNRPADMSITTDPPPVPTDRSTTSRKRAHGESEGAEAAQSQHYYDELNPKKMLLVPGETSL